VGNFHGKRHIGSLDNTTRVAKMVGSLTEGCPARTRHDDRFHGKTVLASPTLPAGRGINMALPQSSLRENQRVTCASLRSRPMLWMSLFRSKIRRKSSRARAETERFKSFVHEDLLKSGKLSLDILAERSELGFGICWLPM
jgi:hypothetical protein